jgi:hypothetical protein
MKKIIHILCITIMVGITSLEVIAQINSSNQQIKSIAEELNGIWHIDFGRTVQSLAGQGKAKYQKMSERFKEHMKKSFENRSFEFEENHGVSIQFIANEYPQNVKGQWAYNQNDNSLTITAGGITMIYLVEWQNKNTIRLISKDISLGMLDQFYLTRKI